MGNNLSYKRDERYGWLNVNPFNLGSAIHCHIRMHFNEQICINSLKEICEKLNIKMEIIGDSNERTVELVNEKVFGFSEFDCMKAFYDSVKEIIQTIEKGIETTVLENEENDGEQPAVSDGGTQEHNSNDKTQDIETVSAVENVEIEQTIEEANEEINENVAANNNDNSQDEQNDQPTNVDDNNLNKNHNSDENNEQLESNNENTEIEEPTNIDANLNDENDIENSEKNNEQIEGNIENAENNEENIPNDAPTVNADENGNASEINQTES